MTMMMCHLTKGIIMIMTKGFTMIMTKGMIVIKDIRYHIISHDIRYHIICVTSLTYHMCHMMKGIIMIVIKDIRYHIISPSESIMCDITKGIIIMMPSL